MLKTYTKFLVTGFVKSFINVFFVMMSLVFILNILKEIEFFSDKDVNSIYPIYLSLMSSPSVIFEMFPFIFLIGTQFFFIKLFTNDEINIFKYSGLKNIQIIKILSLVSFLIGIFAITIFYSFSSNLQHHYIQIKNQYGEDKIYLAVISGVCFNIRRQSGNFIKFDQNSMLLFSDKENLLSTKVFGAVNFDLRKHSLLMVPLLSRSVV